MEVAFDVSGRFLAADEGLDGTVGFLRRGPVANISKNKPYTNLIWVMKKYL